MDHAEQAVDISGQSSKNNETNISSKKLYEPTRMHIHFYTV